MWWLILLHINIVNSFSILGLDNIGVKLEPKKCNKDLTNIVLIHSAPQNIVLRETIRKTWGQNVQKIFILGESHQFNTKISEEHEKYNDILQLDFIDAYRNMTYKHLSGYW